jgi:hypothetical protein
MGCTFAESPRFSTGARLPCTLTAGMVPDAPDEEDKDLRGASEMAPELALSAKAPDASLPASCTTEQRYDELVAMLFITARIFSSRYQAIVHAKHGFYKVDMV